MKKLLIIIMLFIVQSCGTSEPKEPRKNYESEKIKLRQLVNSESKTEQSNGSFFLVWASYKSGEIISNNVKVMGLVDGSYRLISFDLEHARIVIDSTVAKPYIIIRSRYYSEWKSTDEVIRNLNSDKYYSDRQAFYIYCSEELLPEKLLPININ